mmetsp:Transcript_16695/g.41085  ORF Transcript_16695/g.41085 Transcript_16695/m.41085 type:complete len:524 (-) Transcript_16695:515-2086(-)
MRFEDAQERHCSGVAAVWLAGWEQGHLGRISPSLLREWCPNSFHERAKERMKDTTVLIDGERICGFFMVRAEEVYQIYVSKEYQRCGHGRALLAAAERQLVGVGRDQAWSAVVPRNFEARQFYEKCGWMDEGEFDYVSETLDGRKMTVTRHRYKRQLASEPLGSGRIRMMERPRVLVVGAGIIGLTTAMRLVEKGYAPVVMASATHFDDRNDFYASIGAGGLWMPFHVDGGEAELEQWATDCVDVLLEGTTYSECGIQRYSGVEYFHGTSDEWRQKPWWSGILSSRLGGLEVVDHAKLSRGTPDGVSDELRRRYTGAWKFDSLVVNMEKYLAYLWNQLSLAGMTFERKKFNSMKEVVAEAERVNAIAIMNCTGIGARALCGDNAVYPIRGVLVTVKAQSVDHFSGDDCEDIRYIIPRGDGEVALGGREDRNDWSTVVRQNESDLIVERCLQLNSALYGSRVEKAWAGLRPCRTGGVRLEKTQCGTSGKPIVHNYGHGGCGVTLSWGCAAAAVRLIANESNSCL